MLWPTAKVRVKLREFIFYQENQLGKTPGIFFKEMLLFQYLLGHQFHVNSQPSEQLRFSQDGKDFLQIIAQAGWGKAAK